MVFSGLDPGETFLTGELRGRRASFLGTPHWDHAMPPGPVTGKGAVAQISPLWSFVFPFATKG